MNHELTPQDIKDIRARYGLSQRSFARLLGMGEASLARYEKGQKPSRANANLIRAARLPRFVLDCLNRDGSVLSEKERHGVEEIVYAEVYFGEGEPDMDTTEIYHITLTQEVLTEKAWEIMADLFRMRKEAREQGNETLELVCKDIETQLALLTPTIATSKNSHVDKLAEIRGKLDAMQELCQSLDASFAKAA